MQLMMIVNQPDIAAHIASCGVDRIFVDLEYIGKQERQNHLDTWISRHTPEDVSAIRAAIANTPLLVRLNPWHDGSPDEIDDAIARGADLLMLPMFKSIKPVENFCRAVRERVPVIPLAETRESMDILPLVARTPGVCEVFIGLNDLHLSMGQSFMFEPLADGTLDRAAEHLHNAGMPFGFGGLARIGEGLLSAERITGEHARLGSSSAILSRTFHRQAQTLAELKSEMDFALEITRLRSAIAQNEAAERSVLEVNREEVKRIVGEIAFQLNKRNKTNYEPQQPGRSTES